MPKSEVKSLEEAAEALERHLSRPKQERVHLHALAQFHSGRLNISIIALSKGQICGSMVAALPLNRHGIRKPAQSAAQAMTALCSLIVPKGCTANVNFIPWDDVLPAELPSKAAKLRPNMSVAMERQLVAAGQALCMGACELPNYGALVRIQAQDSLSWQSPRGRHVYVDGSADPQGRLGWSAVLVNNGNILRVMHGHMSQWNRAQGCDGATAAEQRALQMGLRLCQPGTVLHTDRVDLMRTPMPPGVHLELTPDCNQPMMRLAHERARAARVKPALADQSIDAPAATRRWMHAAS